jgi:predicted MFS family arabinose efflux permease
LTRQAFVAAVAAGAGNGALLPSQSTLLASLASPQVRHRASAVSRVAGNLGMGLGGALGGRYRVLVRDRPFLRLALTTSP